MPGIPEQKKPVIGIRREDKSEYERRVPFTPDHVRKLIQKGFAVSVQPSKIRVFADKEYEEAGATVQEDLSPCDAIFGVKEIPQKCFSTGANYIFFSHVIKGQSYNMPMLKRMLELGCTLIDYERVVDDKNRRQIFFSHNAGVAGMAESICALGAKLELEGIKTPFTALKRPLDYGDLGQLKAALDVIAKWIASEGLPDGLTPLVVGFAGYGNVSKGAQEIFDILPHETIAAAELDVFMKKGAFSRNKLYKVVFHEKDMVVPVKPGTPFDLQDYYQHPEHYTGVFAQYLPHLTVLINGLYWESRYPRLVTKQWLRENWGKGTRLKVIGDIGNDSEGAIECTQHETDPGSPVFTYLPKEAKEVVGYAGDGPAVMAVGILPTELPKESSASFGDQLMPFVPDIMNATIGSSFEKLSLRPEIMSALIVYKGKLTPNYNYLEKYL
jgi:alpha-aminoadipic semialdehyde synthase